MRGQWYVYYGSRLSNFAVITSVMNVFVGRNSTLSELV